MNKNKLETTATRRGGDLWTGERVSLERRRQNQQNRNETQRKTMIK